MESKAVDKALIVNITDLEPSVFWRCPKLLYILRTSPCAGNLLLSTFDNVLRSGLLKILNVDLNDSQWTQATLPVHMGGPEVRSACKLASSAFLASAAATLTLQEAILPKPLRHTDDLSVSYALSAWKTQTLNAEHSDATRHVQRAWDNTFTDLLSACTIPVDKARLKAVTAPRAGD